jgi:hypothetical protein
MNASQTHRSEKSDYYDHINIPARIYRIGPAQRLVEFHPDGSKMLRRLIAYSTFDWEVRTNDTLRMPAMLNMHDRT